MHTCIKPTYLSFLRCRYRLCIRSSNNIKCEICKKGIKESERTNGIFRVVSILSYSILLPVFNAFSRIIKLNFVYSTIFSTVYVISILLVLEWIHLKYAVFEETEE